MTRLAWSAPARRPSIPDDLTDESFDLIARMAHDRAGLVLGKSKKTMVTSRMFRRIHALGLPSFGQYVDLVTGPSGEEERRRLVGALTTNVSQFFRERHHFDLLRQTVLPPLLTRLKQGRRLRIWSAGCSHGQEPFSIAMTLCDLDADIGDQDVSILATDIDRDVLAFAAAARFPESMLAGVPQDTRTRYFRPVPEAARKYQLSRQVTKLVTFHDLNLHDPWPMRGSFDVIFCRNVLIYFDAAAQAALLARFRAILAPDGWLMLGHSERVPASQAPFFQSAGITTLRKPDPIRTWGLTTGAGDGPA